MLVFLLLPAMPHLMNQPINSFACYAGPDDYQEGVIAAEMMAEALEEG